MEIWKQVGLVLLLAMAPVSELRGAIPAGAAMGLDMKYVFLLSVIGNILPVPILILFVRKILAWMKQCGGRLARIVEWIEKRAEKGKQLFYRYELLGLYILVAIPLPGTGAWTGSLVAAMLRLRLRTAVPVIACGVATAGVIILALTHGTGVLLDLL